MVWARSSRMSGFRDRATHLIARASVGVATLIHAKKAPGRRSSLMGIEKGSGMTLLTSPLGFSTSLDVRDRSSREGRYDIVFSRAGAVF